MFVNNILDFVHKYTRDIYSNSFLLKNIDNVIFCLILAIFALSVFVNSDMIGYFSLVISFLTVIKILFKDNENLKCEIFELFLLAFFMISIISVAGSTLFYLSIKGFTKTLIYLTFYFSVVNHLKTHRNHILPILMMISACVCFESITGLFQNFVKVDEISGWQDVSNLNPEEVITRVYGTLKPLNPNLLGGYFVTAIPAVIGLCLFFGYEKKYLISSLFGILSVFSIAVLFFTGCRGAYIGIFSIIMTLFIVSFKLFSAQYKKLYLSICGIFVLISSFLIVSYVPLRVRILSIFAMREDSSNSYRFNVYKSSLRMFEDNWLLGIGQGNQNFREIYGLYMKTGFDALSAYNIYLELAVEGGIFALFTFIAFIFVLIKDGIKFILKSVNNKEIILVLIPLMSLVGTLVHGFVDTVFFRPQLQIIFWTMTAILSNRLYYIEHDIKK